MSNPPQRSISRYSSIFRQSQQRPVAPQPQARPPPPAPPVLPPRQREPTPPPPSQSAPQAPPSPPPPPPPATRPLPPLSPKPIAPREDSTGLTSGQRSPLAPSSPSTTLSQRQPVSPPLSPVPSRPAADPTNTTGSPLLTSGQRSPTAPSQPEQQKSVIQLAPSPPRPTDLAATTSPIRSPVPGTPTKSLVAAPPRLAPSSPPRPNGSLAETHSPVLASGHRSPVSVHPTASQVPSSPESLSEPLRSPLVRFHSPPLGEANHHRMKPVSPLKLPKQAYPEMSDFEREHYDHKKVVLLEGQPAGGRHRVQNLAAKNNNNNKEVKKEKGVSFVTLAGENRGAVMDLMTSPAGKKQGIGNNGRPRKLVEEGGEEEEEEEEGKHKELGVWAAMRAVVNSNVQGVNNSILHNATYSHHDPGIHLVCPGRSRRRLNLKTSPASR
ncbi:hypothetical protein DM860_007726 [Cuscuta australis]|uniref:Uncharacterized protein n=1 Tax=Cuscuta australis TaxID=267555 RepID=A0A328E8G8_9ASTE|nr:hypothetical protein DM860_007726 [Cuscuta australis]